MTCIVGFVDKNQNVYLGGDSAGVSGLHIVIRKDSKVFRNNNMIFGYTSSFRMGQLLRYKLKIPNQPKNISDYGYMCTLFIDSVRKCLKDNGYTTVDDNEETIGEFLVGYKGSLYHIHGDLQVAIRRDNYDACGCGEVYALGSLFTNTEKNPEKIVKKALETAENFNGGVRRPFNILVLKSRRDDVRTRKNI